MSINSINTSTYTILTWDGLSYVNLDNTEYNSYEEAYSAIIASQELDVNNLIGTSDELATRQDVLQKETPCEQILIKDYDGDNIDPDPDFTETFDTWVID